MTKEENESMSSNNNSANHEVGKGSGGNNSSETSQTNETLNKDQAELAKALEEAKNKSEENWNLFLRTRADMDNFRRRSEIDVDNARKYAVEKFARELLSVVDSLEHGLKVAESEHDSIYREGMTLTLKLLLDTLEKHGVVKLSPEPGVAFDPSRHEALSMQVSQEMEPNKILMVLQPGFLLADRLLRPARVIVSKAE